MAPAACCRWEMTGEFCHTWSNEFSTGGRAARGTRDLDLVYCRFGDDQLSISLIGHSGTRGLCTDRSPCTSLFEPGPVHVACPSPGGWCQRYGALLTCKIRKKDLSPRPPLLRGEGEPNEVLRKRRFIHSVIARTTPSRHPPNCNSPTNHDVSTGFFSFGTSSSNPTVH